MLPGRPLFDVLPGQGIPVVRFSVGDPVIIRYGKRQGRKGIILQSQLGDAYRVKAEDGIILFFSGKGLKPAEAEFLGPLADPSRTTSAHRLLPRK